MTKKLESGDVLNLNYIEGKLAPSEKIGSFKMKKDGSVEIELTHIPSFRRMVLQRKGSEPKPS